MRFLSVITAHRAVVTLVALSLLGASPRLAFDPTPYMHAQRLVDIGGRSMNLYCTGSGSPTVVLDTDGDDPTLQWRFVQPLVAKHTRVCSYDAAGLGFSDPGPLPRDASAYVGDLRALLTRAGIATPIVLVGYSYSGLSARLFADRFPKEVAGMVLVDPNVPYQSKQLGSVAPALKPMLGGADDFAHACAAAAARGALRPGTRPFEECMWPTGPTDPTIPQALDAVVQKQWQRSASWNDLASTGDADSTSSAEVIREQRGYGDMPLIVLTSDSDTTLRPLPIPARQKAAIAIAWMQWHDRIAALSSVGANFKVAGSSEAIAEDRPSSVVSAIVEVVDQSRGRMVQHVDR